MVDQIWSFSPNAYIILEHWTTNSEEKELTAYGAMLWGHANHENAEWGYYETREWDVPHLVSYMESHDEERLMYKNLEYGNSSGGYNIQDLPTALNRTKMAAAFFLTIPGPKMIWQFGELGYDYSINFNEHTGNKPIRWDYFENENSLKLFKTFAILIKLRTNHEVFYSGETGVSMDVAGAVMRIKLTHTSMNAVILDNFDVVSQDAVPNFYFPGRWYDYISGDSLQVTDTNAPLSYEPGEFHIYTSVKLEAPEEGLLTGLRDPYNVNQTVPKHLN